MHKRASVLTIKKDILSMELTHEKPLELIDQLIGHLNKEERNSLVRKLNMGVTSINDLMKSNRMEKEHACVKCGCLNIVKFGKVKRYHAIKDKEGITIGRQFVGEHQRYKCRDCGSTFVSTAKSAFYRSHLTPDQISEVINAITIRKTIRDTAEICQCSTKTSFRWRHKLLDSLTIPNEKVVLGGILEADETGFDLSFKGNPWNHFAFYGMSAIELRTYLLKHPEKTPRAMNEMVNVCCGVDHNREVIATPTNLGKCRMKHLVQTFDKHIEQRSIMCSDKNKAYVRMCNQMNIALVQFKSDDYTTKSGDLSIQKINNYHSNMKFWFKFFRGVATKYLRNYLLWFNFVMWNKKLNTNVKYFEHLSNTVFCENIKDIQKRPAIPFQAHRNYI